MSKIAVGGKIHLPVWRDMSMKTFRNRTFTHPRTRENDNVMYVSF